MAEYTLTRLVFIGDDDRSGLIYYPSYFRYMSESVQLLFEHVGHPVNQQVEENAAGTVVDTGCSLRAPCHVGDRLEQTVTLEIGRRTSFTTRHVFRREDGVVVAEGHVVRVWVNLETMRPLPLPQWVHDAATVPGRIDLTSLQGAESGAA